MANGDVILAWADAATREATLFAAIGFLIGGIDDLAVDFVYLLRRLLRGSATLPIERLPGRAPMRFAILVPAWDESAVIGAMLRTTLARLRHPAFRILVGCYPNDAATIAAVEAIAMHDDRVLLVIGPRPGPTTKADCLNHLWQACEATEAVDAIVLHDAEDVVHPDELAVFEALLGHHAAVQLPVLPLVQSRARLVSGHYADEFAHAHGALLVVRSALGAGMPFAGVGCAIRCDAVRAIAAAHGAAFDAESLTEDYELGLRVAALGHRTRFARIRAADATLVATREYFPSTVAAAVGQKARWMTGIALAGWDRLGWGRWSDLGEHWMRMRDRRAPIAVVVLAAGYAAIVGWGLTTGWHWWAGTPAPEPSTLLKAILFVNLGLLVWRLMVRAAFTTRAYGWREGLWSVPRVFVGNAIALLAARRAAVRYGAMLLGRPPRWDKTAHDFPTLLEAAE